MSEPPWRRLIMPPAPPHVQPVFCSACVKPARTGWVHASGAVSLCDDCVAQLRRAQNAETHRTKPGESEQP
jgi:hypothetical protein